jgi:fatty acid desaturase
MPVCGDPGHCRSVIEKETILRKNRVEWPTLAALAGCYGVWAVAVWGGLPLAVAVPVLAVAIAFHASLSHEAIHGHPFADPRLNALVVAPPLALVIPYARFRATHLAHHYDPDLTDPYDDPESNYLDPGVWQGLPPGLKVVLRVNNTLAGRIVLGPLIGTFAFALREVRAAREDPAVVAGWTWHIPAAAVVVWVVAASPLGLWAYGAAVYGALALLRIRTFAEHRAHERARGRTVVIEDRGPLALLFLNNNLHAVHHAHPGVAWYRLPAIYALRRSRFLAMNDGFVFASYAAVFRRHLFAAKDPVAHPLVAPRPAAAAAMRTWIGGV